MPFAKMRAFAALLLSAGMLWPMAASAETIFGALVKAYQLNSTLNAERAGVRVTDEDVAIAKSGYRPTISGVAQGDYESNSTTRIATGFFEGIHFSMRFAGALVRSLTKHHAVVRYDAGADDRVWRRPPKATARVLDRPPHPPFVVYHFSWNNAST